MRKAACNLHERSCQAFCFFCFLLQGWAVQRPRTHCTHSSIWKKKIPLIIFNDLADVILFPSVQLRTLSPVSLSGRAPLPYLIFLNGVYWCRAADILIDLHSAAHGRKLPTCFQTTAHNHQAICTNTVPWRIVLVQRYGNQIIRERDTNYIHFHFCVV